jgi:hypothetical protein
LATAVVTPAARAHAPGTYDRVFYSTIAILMALTVFAGFARTYYLRTYFGAPVSITGAVTLTPLAQLHAAVFTAWVLLFVVQTALVAARRVAVHRRLGMAGAVLASAMVVIGATTAIAAAARGSAPPGIDPLVFLVIPLTDVVLFAGFVTAAIRLRRNREAHKRLMLVAYVSIIVAAVARMPGVISLTPLAFFGFSFVFVLAGMAYDRVSRGRIHPAYLWGGGVFLASVPLRLAISATPAWRSFAEFLIAARGAVGVP